MVSSSTPTTGGGEQLLALGEAIGDWEPLTVHNLDEPGGLIRSGQRVALQAPNGQFVFALDGGGGRLIVRGPAIGEWEPFTLEMWSHVTLQSAHGKFMCAEGGGGGKLVADRDHPHEWETFRFYFIDGMAIFNGELFIIRQHGLRFVLRAANQKFVYANNGGGEQLLAQGGPGIGGWEPLTLHILNEVGADTWRVAIQTVSGEFVYADPSGDVWARSTEVRDWETFTLRFPTVLNVG